MKLFFSHCIINVKWSLVNMSKCCSICFSSIYSNVLSQNGFLYDWQFLRFSLCNKWWEIIVYSENVLFLSIYFYLFLQELVQGFDQETAAVVMARLASYKMENEVLSLHWNSQLSLAKKCVDTISKYCSRSTNTSCNIAFVVWNTDFMLRLLVGVKCRKKDIGGEVNLHKYYMHIIWLDNNKGK